VFAGRRKRKNPRRQTPEEKQSAAQYSEEVESHGEGKKKLDLGNLFAELDSQQEEKKSKKKKNLAGKTTTTGVRRKREKGEKGFAKLRLEGMTWHKKKKEGRPVPAGDKEIRLLRGNKIAVEEKTRGSLTKEGSEKKRKRTYEPAHGF